MGLKARRGIVAALTLLSIAVANADQMAHQGGGYGPPGPSYGPPPPSFGVPQNYGYPVGSIKMKGKFGDEIKGKVDNYGDLFSTGLEEMKKNVKKLFKLDKLGNKGEGGYGGYNGGSNGGGFKSKSKNKFTKGAEPVYGHYKVHVKGPTHHYEPQYPDHFAPVPPPYYGLPPKAHYGAPAPSYGAPAPSYAAPVPSPAYGPPASSYGPPPPLAYRAPEPAYEAPVPSPSYGAPAPSPSYGAPPPPSPSYGAPAPSYEAPAPSPSYGAPAPAPAYEAPPPSSSYGAPVPPPTDSYGPPVPVHSHPAPTNSYAAPAPVSSYDQGVTKITYTTNDQTPVVQGNYNDQAPVVQAPVYSSQPAVSYQPQPPLLPSYAELPHQPAAYATQPPPTYNPVGQSSSVDEEFVEPPKKVKTNSKLKKTKVVADELENGQDDPRPVFVPKRRPSVTSASQVAEKKEQMNHDVEQHDGQNKFVVFSNPTDVAQGSSS